MSPASLLAVVLALLVTRKAPAHRPVALALFTAKVVELVRPSLPPRLAMAALLMLPVLSVWSTVFALRWSDTRELCAAAWMVAAAAVITAPRAEIWWDAVWPTGLGVGVAIQTAAWWRWRRTGGVAGVTQRTAVALAAGDFAAFAIGVCLGWPERSWAEAVAVVTCLVQGAWLLNFSRRES